MKIPRVLKDSPSPHLSVHVIAPGKYGKTTSLATAPKPLLIGDADGGIETLLKKAVSGAAREGISFVRLESYQDGLDLVTSLWKQGPGGKPFATVAIDTFSWYLQSAIKGEILRAAGREKMELQDWGYYFERGLAIAKKAHELAVREDGCHTILTFHEADKGGEDNQIGKLGPSVQGQLFDVLPGIPNFVFFMRIQKAGLDPQTRQAVLRRVFQTAADQRTPAGSRRDLDTYEAPDFSAIWQKVRQKGNA